MTFGAIHLIKLASISIRRWTLLLSTHSYTESLLVRLLYFISSWLFFSFIMRFKYARSICTQDVLMREYFLIFNIINKYNESFNKNSSPRRLGGISTKLIIALNRAREKKENSTTTINGNSRNIKCESSFVERLKTNMWFISFQTNTLREWYIRVYLHMCMS